MTDLNIPAAAPTVTCWRDVGFVFRRREYRLPVALALLAVAEAYLLCFLAAWLVAIAVYVWVVEPALTAAFGRVPGPFLVQLATGSVVGGSLFWVNVRLMYRAANRWMRPRTKQAEGRSDV